MKELEITVIAKCQLPLLAFHFFSPISLVHFDMISSISLVNFSKLQARLVMECTDGVSNLWSQTSYRNLRRNAIWVTERSKADFTALNFFFQAFFSQL